MWQEGLSSGTKLIEQLPYPATESLASTVAISRGLPTAQSCSQTHVAHNSNVIRPQCGETGLHSSRQSLRSLALVGQHSKILPIKKQSVNKRTFP